MGGLLPWEGTWSSGLHAASGPGCCQLGHHLSGSRGWLCGCVRYHQAHLSWDGSSSGTHRLRLKSSCHPTSGCTPLSIRQILIEHLTKRGTVLGTSNREANKTKFLASGRPVTIHQTPLPFLEKDYTFPSHRIQVWPVKSEWNYVYWLVHALPHSLFPLVSHL